jgi:hypothetical protein
LVKLLQLHQLEIRVAGQVEQNFPQVRYFPSFLCKIASYLFSFLNCNCLGKVGYFPADYVEILKEDNAQETQKADASSNNANSERQQLAPINYDASTNSCGMLAVSTVSVEIASATVQEVASPLSPPGDTGCSVAAAAAPAAAPGPADNVLPLTPPPPPPADGGRARAAAQAVGQAKRNVGMFSL